MDTPVSPLQVHTTDRSTFRSCRLRWHFSSNLRLNLRPPITPEALLFGSAIHAGLAGYYIQNKSLPIGLAHFEVYLENWYMKETDQGPEVTEQYDALLTLGKDMLWHYDDTYKNDGLTAVLVEWPFDIKLGPCPYCKGTRYTVATEIPCPKCNGTGDLLYSGQIDGLVRDRNGRLWIIEHKTADKITDDEEYLQLDDQCTSYLWALSILKPELKIEGVIYNTLSKHTPNPLKVNLNGKFSLDKRQTTTYKIAYEQVKKEFGTLPIPPDLEEFLQYLASGYDDAVDIHGQPNRFFRRVAVRRSKAELVAQGKTIELEVADMLDPNLRIYKNPNRFNCGGCPFHGPCIAYYSGGDVQTQLDGNYVSRD